MNSSNDGAIKKSVRFANGASEVVCYVMARGDLTTDEIDETWWSQAAMKEFYRSAMILSNDARQSKFMVTGFEQAYEASQSLVNCKKSVKATSHKTLENINVPPDLVNWCRFGHSWRGLERSSSALHDYRRTRSALQAKSIVLDMMKDESTNNIQAVRRAYQRASRSAKIFARIMGEADAMALNSPVQLQQQKLVNVKPKSSSMTLSKSTPHQQQIQQNIRHAPLMLRLALSQNAF